MLGNVQLARALAISGEIDICRDHVQMLVKETLVHPASNPKIARIFFKIYLLTIICINKLRDGLR